MKKKERKFRVSIKRNNDFAYFINKANADDFYIYTGRVWALKEDKTYKESDLVIEGSYVKHVKNLF